MNNLNDSADISASNWLRQNSYTLQIRLREMSAVERWIRIFWLLGPFILLIERTPADVWLSSLALLFLGRAAIQRDFRFLKVGWVRLAFLFWLSCLISAAISADPSYSIGEAFAWIRFPLFAMASVFWLADSRQLIFAMLVSMFIGMLVMCGILVAEILITGRGLSTRLMWPYGDLVPGSYLAKACLPAFVILSAFAMHQRKKFAVLSGLIVLINLAISILTGERVNFLTRLCSALLAPLSWKLEYKRFVVFVLAASALVGTVFILFQNRAITFTLGIYHGVTAGFESDYVRVLGGGWTVFKDAPILGIGPGNYRNYAEMLLADQLQFRPDNHPHNFYIQFLAETGVVGFVLGTAFLMSMIWYCWRARRNCGSDVVRATAYIVPLACFWPLTSTADFFGQWNNIFIWSGIAIALAACYPARDTQK